MRGALAATWTGLIMSCGWSVHHELILSSSGLTGAAETSGTGEPGLGREATTSTGLGAESGDDSMGSSTGSGATSGTESGDPPQMGCTDRWGQPGWGFDPPVLLGVNSELLEGDPQLSADGLTLSFSSNRAGGAGGFDLYVATRGLPSGPFEPPVPQTALNTEFDDTSLSWIEDGSAVFASTRSTAGQWSTLWHATPALELSPLDALDVPGLNNYDPFVAADGLRLYWTAADGANDDLNLRVAVRDSLDGSFEAMGGLPFETTAYDDNLTLSADGRVAVWGSELAEGPSAHNLWFATRSSPDVDFGDAALISDLNSDDQDREGFVTADGCAVFFVSDRPGGVGQWDLYMASVRLD